MERFGAPYRIVLILMGLIVLASLAAIFLLPLSSHFRGHALRLDLVALAYVAVLYLASSRPSVRPFRYLISITNALVVTGAYFEFRDQLPSIILFYIFIIVYAVLLWDTATTILTAAFSTLGYAAVIALTGPLEASRALDAGLMGVAFLLTGALAGAGAKQLKLRTEQLSALNAIAQTVSQSLDQDTVLSATLDKALETLEFESGAIYVKDIETGELEMKQHRGLSEEFWRAMARGIIFARVAESGTPIIMDDLPKEPNAPKDAIEEGYRFQACIPLLSKGQVHGVLTIASRQLRPLRQQDIDLLLSIGNQMGVAIENARLFEVEQRKRQEAETLRHAAQALSTTLDLQEVLESILSELQKVVPYDSASVQLLKGDLLEIIGGHGFPNLDELLGISFPVKGDNPNRQVVATRAPFIVEDAPTLYSAFGEEPHAQAGIRAWLGVPLLFGDRLIGMIALDKRVPGFYNEEHARLAMAFAAQAAIAIENARLYEEEQRRSAQRRTIAEVGRRAAAILEMDVLLPQVVDLIAANFSYYRVHIFQLDPDSEYVIYKAGTGKADPVIAEEGLRLKVGEEGIIGWVAQSKQPLMANDVNKEPRYYFHPALPDTRSELAVPICLGEKIIGVLDVQSTEPDAFDESDLETLQTLADQLAVAMENARLYEETKRLAITDGLTGLYNLRYFYEALEKEIQRSERYHRSLSLTILDIDDFKAYNDLYGHLAGDDLLIEFAQLMSKVIRQTDTLARYGGEEFVIILPETETERARFLIERLQQEVGEHRFSIQDGQAIGRITISLGVATYPHHADSAKSLLDAADRALLRAKQAGKNRISVHGEMLTELEPR